MGAFDMYGSEAYPGVPGAGTVFDYGSQPSNPFGDPKAMALLGLAQGLLSAGAPHSTPVGLGGALSQGIGGALNGAMSAQKMNQQQTLVDLEKQKVALTQAQAAKLMQQEAAQQAIVDKIRAWEASNGQPTGISDSSANAIGAPYMAASNVPQRRAPFPLSLADIAMAPNMLPIYKEAQPNISIQNGFQVDPRQGIVGAVPQTNQQGFSTITVPDGKGGFTVQMVPGGREAFTTQQLISQGANAAYGSPITIPASSPNENPRIVNPYRFAVSQGAPDVLSAPRNPAAPTSAPGGSGMGGQAAGLSAAQQADAAANAEQQKDVAKNYAKIYNDLQNASMQNPAKIAKVQRIGTLLGDFEGGKLSQTGLELSRLGNSLGIRLDEKLPNKEAATALTNEVALELRSTASGNGMPGAMSDADREFLKQMTPQMSQTAEGRKTIIDAKVKLMDRENQVAQMARQYRKKYGRLDEDFFSQLQEWSNRNQIFKQ